MVEAGEPKLDLDIIRSLDLTLQKDRVVHVPIRQVSCDTPPNTMTTAQKSTPQSTMNSEQDKHSIRASFPDLFNERNLFACVWT